MSEATEQAALFEWAARMEERLPALRMLFAVPNGGYRHKATAARLKAEGVKAGVPDVWLPVASIEAHGLVIEMKHGKNNLTGMQMQWFHWLRLQGYQVHLCYDWTEAAYVIVRYLGCDPADFGLAGRAVRRVGE